ncbi:MAG TPA: hypothetical protein PLJ78_08095 [Anaerolineae bacterium]|nr:hypothetical protein [Anaerolineae bacterium]HQK13886.1 hypothetical protein [Anaerolineae bacterium]
MNNPLEPRWTSRLSKLPDLLIGKDVAALNIIPNRNWNIADPEDLEHSATYPLSGDTGDHPTLSRG